MISGVIIGVCASGSLALAQDVNVPSPGNPNLHNGYDGTSRISSTNRTGKFNSIQDIGIEIISIIEVILVPLVMALALLAFLWGVMQYIRNGSDPKEREQARGFMLWGIIGLAVMASVWGLVRIITNTIGVPSGTSTVPSLNQIR